MTSDCGLVWMLFHQSPVRVSLVLLLLAVNNHKLSHYVISWSPDIQVVSVAGSGLLQVQQLQSVHCFLSNSTQLLMHVTSLWLFCWRCVTGSVEFNHQTSWGQTEKWFDFRPERKHSVVQKNILIIDKSFKMSWCLVWISNESSYINSRNMSWNQVPTVTGGSNNKPVVKVTRGRSSCKLTIILEPHLVVLVCRMTV